MYCRHFRLRIAPFRFAPAREGLYIGAQHREAVAALEWGLLHEPSGFTMLVGEPGVGKTTLLGHVLRQHHEYIRTVSVPNPRLSAEEILRSIVDQLVPGPSPSGKLDTLYAFERSIDRLRPGERLAIVIDEAQALSDDALEEVRLLSNCRRSEEKQLQLLLIGQPELLRRLATPTLRQLDQRVGARAILSPLQPAEAYQYVSYLVQLSGGSADRIFRREALDYLITLSDGIPRRINILCHRAMLQAYISGLRRVTIELARAAVAEDENPFVAVTAPDEPGVRLAHAQERQLPAGQVQARTADRFSQLAALVRRAEMVAGLVILAAVIIYIYHRVGVRIYPRETPGSRSAFREAAAKPAHAPQKSANAFRPAPVTTPSVDSPSPQAQAGARIAQAPQSSAAVDGGPSTVAAHAVFVKPVSSTQTSKSATSAASTLTATGRRQIAIQAGDTLDDIAIRYLGSEQELERLIHANPQFSNANRIYPGQIVYLPNAKEPARTEASP
jgi:type II secretory pathway predicted ATPase ExeA